MQVRTQKLRNCGAFLHYNINFSEVLYSKAEQNCEAKAYLTYVEQAIAVPIQLDSAYGKFTNIRELLSPYV